MPNKMLIDATHPEETRVVVVRGNKVEDFDFESADRRPLRGNIYLAKVTRVEPSLQAAFIEYGGNRHGFLAFSEIHPDYYQIPVADREALLAEDARAHQEEESGRGRQRRRNDPRRSQTAREAAEDAEVLEAEQIVAEGTGGEPRSQDLGDEAREGWTAASQSEGEGTDLQASDDGFIPADVSQSDADLDDGPEFASPQEESEEEPEFASPEEERDDGPSLEDAAEQLIAAGDVEAGIALQSADEEEQSSGVGEVVEISSDDEDEEQAVEHLGGGDALEEMPVRSVRRQRHYKIQEVIRRRQIMLVQVVKEERGTKGAALTTYLSLAGRYSVLMPNTARGGGISRKINDAQDRKRLRDVVDELEVPEGMGIILRTAGASRTKTEIKRDFEYLLRLWETIRDVTLKSTAPSLVYEEGSLIKRSIRDLYNKDVDQILVAGEEAYREAKDFMRMLMPSHAKVVQPYREQRPIFSNDNVEGQLDAMFNAHVTLKSGGYIVINQTEALVAIDVNSGRSTREHNIEDTATRTNLEAADEVARQLRLRDLAGLIVVDFIDMEESRNNRAVERRMKDALRNDRARIQVGRISHFGLLEMSRQRIRTGVLESSSIPCPHCGGTGSVRSVPSVALHVLRLVEDHLRKDASYHLSVRVSSAVALYILNQKRWHVQEIERRYTVDVFFTGDETLSPHQHAIVEKREPVSEEDRAARSMVRVDSVQPMDDFDDGAPDAFDDDEDEAAPPSAAAPSEAVAMAASDSDEAAGRKRRRRRRRRGASPSGLETADAAGMEQPFMSDEAGEEGDEYLPEADAGDAQPEAGRISDGDEPSRRRRRGRRGGRRGRREPGLNENEGTDAEGVEANQTTIAWDDEEGDAPLERVSDVDGTDRPVEPLALEGPDSLVSYQRDTDAISAAEVREEFVHWDPSIAGPDVQDLAEPGDPERREPDTDTPPIQEPGLPEEPFEDPGTPPQPAPEQPPAPEPAPEQPPAIAEEEPRSRRTGWWNRRLLG